MYEPSEVSTFVAISTGALGEDGVMSWIVKFEGSVLTDCGFVSVCSLGRRRGHVV